MNKVDVLIVGAGPVGLTLAIECRRQGVSFRIVDKNPGPSDKSKALGIWSGTIECMAAMGVVDEFLARSMPGHGLMFHDTGKFLNRICIHEGVESLYPVPMLIPQCWTEEILATHLHRAGVKIERPLELSGMKDDGSGVEATLTHPDGTTETIRAKWLAGCDGAHSFARHHLPVTFDGVPENSAFILCDAKVEGDVPPDHLFINWGPTGVCIFFPVKPGIFRLFQVRPDTTNHAPPTLDEMNSFLRDNGLGRLRMYDPEWLAYFGVNERFASRARVGRVFLLGDAAHVHSPAGGQGMNTGMQDAFNLGWKLALLTRGRGDTEAIAESFHAERHPIAKMLIEKTTKLLHFGMAHGKFMRVAKDIAVKHLFQTQFVQARLSGELSELHIAYPESPLVVSDDPAWHGNKGFKPGTKPRDVALVHAVTREMVSLWRQFLTTKHTLVLFSGTKQDADISSCLAQVAAFAKKYGDYVQVIIIWAGESTVFETTAEVYFDPEGNAHERFGVEQPVWYLVRPDQYLAARGMMTQTELLAAYLKKVLG